MQGYETVGPRFSLLKAKANGSALLSCPGAQRHGWTERGGDVEIPNSTNNTAALTGGAPGPSGALSSFTKQEQKETPRVWRESQGSRQWERHTAFSG